MHCGTVLGDEFAAMLKMYAQNSPTMYIDNHHDSVSSATLNWRIAYNTLASVGTDAFISGIRNTSFLLLFSFDLSVPFVAAKTLMRHFPL